MMLNRRSLIRAGLLLAAAPVIVRADSLMPVRALLPAAAQWYVKLTMDGNGTILRMEPTLDPEGALGPWPGFISSARSVRLIELVGGSWTNLAFEGRVTR